MQHSHPFGQHLPQMCTVAHASISLLEVGLCTHVHVLQNLHKKYGKEDREKSLEIELKRPDATCANTDDEYIQIHEAVSPKATAFPLEDMYTECRTYIVKFNADFVLDQHEYRPLFQTHKTKPTFSEGYKKVIFQGDGKVFFP